MSDSSSTAAVTSGSDFAGLLTIAFIVLKLVGVITWPWLWVLAPLWIGFLLVVGIVAGFLLFDRLSR